jgi:hypothetical protein
MRIAVCICGQPRTWRTSSENIKQYFNVDAEVDYFIHTWDTNSYGGVDELVDDPDIELKGIKDSFNPKLIILEHYDPEIDRFGWQHIFRSFMKSIWLKKNYEIENDFIYDIVIKTRFDIVFSPRSKFHINMLQPQSIYSNCRPCVGFPQEFNIPMINDVFFYGDSPTMDIASKTYFWIRSYQQKVHDNSGLGVRADDVEVFCGSGSIFYNFLISWNILPTFINDIQYYTIRKNMEGLNCDTEWDKICKMSNDFYNL